MQEQEKEIVIRFNIITGEAKVEAHGFKGSSCAKATEFIKDSLGECTDFQRKAEWYEENLTHTGEVVSNLCG